MSLLDVFREARLSRRPSVSTALVTGRNATGRTTAVPVHRVKIDREFFEVIAAGRKTYEVRRNDRDYHEGDVIVLWETAGERSRYTGRSCARRVGYLLPVQRLPDLAWVVVFSLLPIDDDTARDAIALGPEPIERPKDPES